ncbi:MAG: nitroreductase family deazaflavin-dependent oxidoreductase [Deltaproteobacteria bacterium]|nr:nitroreductase family deazaflavin-dependent oxidoreductase [Deltaproteobacteria bacterium]
MAEDLQKYARVSTVQLTTIGRKSQQPRTVKIWFVVIDSQRIVVQHVRGDDANWYRNLVKNPEVDLDFGDGAIHAIGRPIRGRDEIRDVLRLIRRKYWMAWLLQAFGTGNAVAAHVDLHLPDKQQPRPAK